MRSSGPKPTVVIAEVTGVASTGDRTQLSHLLTLHGALFPEHAHVLPELEDNARLPHLRGERVIHQFLALVDNEPAGFIIVHTNLARRIGLIHFLGVAEPYRGITFAGRRLSAQLVDTACEQIHADGQSLGVSIVNGVVAESEPYLIGTWQHLGFTQLAAAYAEPYFGMHWAAHGDPEFFPMTLVHRPASDLSEAIVTIAAAQAFLLDHYQLSPANALVSRILRSS